MGITCFERPFKKIKKNTQFWDQGNYERSIIYTMFCRPALPGNCF